MGRHEARRSDGFLWATFRNILSSSQAAATSSPRCTASNQANVRYARIPRNQLFSRIALSASAGGHLETSATSNPMNNPVLAPPTNVPQSIPGLLLHCGGEVVNRSELSRIAVPESTETWFPLPHCDLVTEVERQLQGAGFQIQSAFHALSHEGARYFGILQVGLLSREPTDYGWVIGLRNSHDKTYPAGLVAGTRVFVCDNLAFTGEVKLSRKHTKNAARDLQHLTARAVGQLGDRFDHLDRRIAAYRDEPMADWAAHDLVVRAVDCKAITPTQIPRVLEEWRKPRYPEFESRTAWSLFNAFTEVQKSGNPQRILPRSEALHGLFDAAVGLELAS